MSARPNSDGFKTVRRSDLINMLREKGFSKRKAAAGVKAVFALMTRALWSGENVDLPVGSIHAKSPPAGRKQRMQKFRNIQTREVFYRLIRPPKRMILFTKDPRSILRGPDALPPPPPIRPERQRKVEELEQLFSQLMGREMTLPDFKKLLVAAVDPNKPDNDPYRPENVDRLVARLRQLVKEECRVADLPSEVRLLYWVR
jgi:nucleoid DNA-binding protein